MDARYAATLAMLFAVVAIVESVKIFPVKNGEDYDYWMRRGREELNVALKRLSYIRGDGVSNRFLKRPKNVIVFVGDGMSLTTVTASRIYKGQQRHDSAGEDHSLIWETFPETAMMKTYNTDRQTPDSAGTATAMFSGVKTRSGLVGYDDTVLRGSAQSAKNARKLDSILGWGQDAGKKTGIVTTARLTHATPAALYANSPNRDWECDAALKRENGVGGPTGIAEGEEDPDYEENPDIARQMIKGKTGSNANILLGGGLGTFKAIPGITSSKWTCVREDGRDLVQEWLDDKREARKRYEYVNNTKKLLELDNDNVDHVLGIFASSHMDYDYARDKGPEGQPSLSQMVVAAIKTLKNNDNKGFVLAVESGRIDHGHHSNRANVALDETMAFDQAVRDAINLLEEEGILDDTLMLVTADHSHVMTMNGYAKRGTDIRGVTGDETDEGLQEPILSYANGQGQRKLYPTQTNDEGKCERVELNDDEMKSFDYRHPAMIFAYDEHHGGDDVGLWAVGPMSYFFHKTHEQSYIAHVIGYSLCIGPYADFPECRVYMQPATYRSSATSVAITDMLLLVPAILLSSPTL